MLLLFAFVARAFGCCFIRGEGGWDGMSGMSGMDKRQGGRDAEINAVYLVCLSTA